MFPWDKTTPRFYPPGQHPAIYRWYAQLRKMEELERVAMSVVPPEFAKALTYVREQIAAFEERESELKLEAYVRSR